MLETLKWKGSKVLRRMTCAGAGSRRKAPGLERWCLGFGRMG